MGKYIWLCIALLLIYLAVEGLITGDMVTLNKHTDEFIQLTDMNEEPGQFWVSFFGYSFFGVILLFISIGEIFTFGPDTTYSKLEDKLNGVFEDDKEEKHDD